MKAAAQFCFFCLSLVALVCSATPGEAQAQTGPAPRAAQRPTAAARPASAAGTAVAVVDVSYVFENHSGFKDAMDRMKQEVQQYEEELRTRQPGVDKGP